MIAGKVPRNFVRARGAALLLVMVDIVKDLSQSRLSGRASQSNTSATTALSSASLFRALVLLVAGI